MTHALVETHTNTDDSGYSFHVTKVTGFEDNAAAEFALAARMDELSKTDGAGTGFNVGGRGGITVAGPAVGLADDCPARVTLTVTEIL